MTEGNDALPLTIAQRGRRLPSTHPLVPVVIGGVLIATLTAVSMLAPQQYRSAAMTVAGAAIILAAFLRLPKPTLLVFALFILFYDSFGRWLGGGTRQIDEAAIPGLLLISLWRTRPWQRGLIEPLRDGAILAVAVLAVVASLVNGVPLNVWLISLLLLLKGVVFLYIVQWHAFSREDVRQFSIIVLAVGSVVLLLGFAETVNGELFRQVFNLPLNADVRGQLPGIKSLFVFPVLFSWFMAFVAIFLISHYLVLRRLWMLVAALFFGVGMFLSGRRRAIIGLAFALVGGAVAQISQGVSRRTMLRVWAPVGLVALVLAVVFSSGLVRLYEQTINEYFNAPPPPSPQDPASGGIEFVRGNPRLLLYTTSVTIAGEHFPLGVGLGRFGSPMSRVEFSPVYAQYGLDRIWGLTPQYPAYVTDTFWPHILGEIGVLGLGFYVVFLAAIGVGLWRATRWVKDPNLNAFVLGAWMVFLHTLVESLASSMYESPPRIYLAFGSLGVALALSRIARQEAATGLARQPRS